MFDVLMTVVSMVWPVAIGLAVVMGLAAMEKSSRAAQTKIKQL